MSIGLVQTALEPVLPAPSAGLDPLPKVVPASRGLPAKDTLVTHGLTANDVLAARGPTPSNALAAWPTPSRAPAAARGAMPRDTAVAREPVFNRIQAEGLPASDAALADNQSTPSVAHSTATALEPVPRSSQTAIVRRYLSALQNSQYGEAYRLLNESARRYYRDPQNYASVYLADGYRVTRFSLLGTRGNDRLGRVFFARETAQFRDHAHDTDLAVTATVPVGVVPESGGWRIKDPGHPWRAFAARASADANGLRVIVKKVSFFARRIEAVVTFVNTGSSFITVLPYGKSILRDAAGRPYRLIETRDWSLTDRTLFEGLRLAPNAQYTGMLAFECPPLDDSARTFALTVSPLLVDGADTPFSINVDAIAAAGALAPAAK